MTTFTFPDDHLANYGNWFRELGHIPDTFDMAVMQSIDNRTSQLILVHNPREQELHTSFKDLTHLEPDISITVIKPVELLHIHGPHFQDRFGVAHAALAAIKKQQSEILAASCSGTSICLVTPEQKVHAIARALEGIFVVP